LGSKPNQVETVSTTIGFADTLAWASSGQQPMRRSEIYQPALLLCRHNFIASFGFVAVNHRVMPAVSSLSVLFDCTSSVSFLNPILLADLLCFRLVRLYGKIHLPERASCLINNIVQLIRSRIEISFHFKKSERSTRRGWPTEDFLLYSVDGCNTVNLIRLPCAEEAAPLFAEEEACAEVVAIAVVGIVIS
jgi:hypothetical protein